MEPALPTSAIPAGLAVPLSDADVARGGAKAPKVSVIIPARDEQANIGRCLRSILAQQGIAFQVIVVDDHSTDRTAEIARRLMADVAGGTERVGGPYLPAVGKCGSGSPLPLSDATSAGNPYRSPQSAARRAGPAKPTPLRAPCRMPKASGCCSPTLIPNTRPAPSPPPSKRPNSTGPIFFRSRPSSKSKAFASVRSCRLFSRNWQPHSARAMSPTRSSPWRQPTASTCSSAALFTTQSAGMPPSPETCSKMSLSLAAPRPPATALRFRIGKGMVRTRMYRGWRQMREGWTKNLALLFPDAHRLACRRMVEFAALVAPVRRLPGEEPRPSICAPGRLGRGLGKLSAARAQGAFRPALDRAGRLRTAALCRPAASFRPAHRDGRVEWKGRDYYISPASAKIEEGSAP